jgi:hypothetical protein
MDDCEPLMLRASSSSSSSAQWPAPIGRLCAIRDSAAVVVGGGDGAAKGESVARQGAIDRDSGPRSAVAARSSDRSAALPRAQLIEKFIESVHTRVVTRSG